VANELGYDVIELQTIPKRRFFGLGPTAINKVTGWSDSFFYDIDLALAVIKAPSENEKGLIAWSPQAFTAESRSRVQSLDIDKIEVSLAEAKKAYACNLVSTGETVIMTCHAPNLKLALEGSGLKVVTLDIQELSKGGGFIRCVSLTLDNK
jgi:N-dimethylarginine dimethylaminohydrolase